MNKIQAEKRLKEIKRAIEKETGGEFLDVASINLEF